MLISALKFLDKTFKNLTKLRILARFVKTIK